MTREHSPYVAYESEAARYHRGRALPGEVLNRWGEAVRPHLPHLPSESARPLRVLDVGAGTGIFAAAWPAWTAASVVALEPSAAMARAAPPRGVPAWYVQGRAEAIPLPAASVDVAWFSTSLHHVTDLDRAVSELDRVVRANGRVLVRTHLPGHTHFFWLDEMPGRERWEARLHTADELTAMFAPVGFGITDVVDVVESTETCAAVADWIERMRHTDSMLTALTDDEVAEGVARLRATPERAGRLELTLVVLARTG